MQQHRFWGASVSAGVVAIALGNPEQAIAQAARDIKPIAAVVRHVAAPVPSSTTPLYLLVGGKVPAEALMKALSGIPALKAPPAGWRPGSTEHQAMAIDVTVGRRLASGAIEISATMIAPWGLATQSCTYRVGPKHGAWEVAAGDVRCLVL